MSDINLSKRDIRFLKLLYKIGSFLASNPPYDFEKRVITNPLLNKIQAFLLIIFLTIASALTLYDEMNFHTQQGSEMTSIVMEFINFIFLFTLPFLTVVNSCLFSHDSWLKLNNNFQYVDAKLNNRNKRENNLFRNFYFQFVLSIGGFLICNVYVTYYCFKILPTLVLSPAFIIYEIFYLYEFVICILICNIASAFKYRYEDINKLLESNFTSTFEPNISKVKNSVSLIREVGNLWRILRETITCFNKIFGWSLICLCGRGILQILMSLKYMFALNKNVIINNDTFNQNMFVTNLFIFTYILVSMIFVITSCDYATSAGKKTMFLCYKIQKDFLDDSKERKELMLLAREISDSGARFTAADFFEINRSTFFGILSVTTTYLIILIQFNT